MKGGYIIQNKRGLSAIITTLLVILLVLVAVGIVWGVVSGVLTGGAEELEFSAKCLSVDVRATAVLCTGADCVVTLERTGTNNDAIGGVKLVFRDSVNSESSSVIDVLGDIPALAGRTTASIPSEVTAPDSVGVTAYFVDASGNEQFCAQTATKNF